MQPRFLAILISIAFVFGALVPLGTGQTPLVDVSLGIVYEENFDEGDGGWTANEYEEPTRPEPVTSWAWGEPTSGPGSAVSGTHVWATNPDGLYDNDECGAILSPPIDLTDAETASVSFQHWRSMEVGWYAYDGGALFVTADGGETLDYVTPEEGYDSKSLYYDVRQCFDGASYSARAFTGTSDGWTTTTVDLDDYAGEVVQLAMSFASRNRNPDLGWYVDDFAVTVDGETTVETFEESDGGFTLVSTEPAPLAPQGWAHGMASVGPGTDSPLWGVNLDGDYGPNECSWVESPAFVLGEDYPQEAGVAVTAELTWLQWFRTNSGVGAGVVQVGDGSGNYVNVVPDGGYDGSNRYLKDAHEACLEYESQESGAFAGLLNREGDAMVEYAADLTPWLGQEITLRFLFATSDSSLMNTGWYVDDVSIELLVYEEAPSVDEYVPEVPEPSGMDAPGWSSGGEDSTWAYGVAGSGPVGELAYATNLEGSYADDECSYIDSPPVPGALLHVNPTLEFTHWYDIYQSSYSGTAWSGGVVLVSTDGGESWTYLDLPEYTGEAKYSGMRACLQDVHGLDFPTMTFSGEQHAFETVTVDLSEFADAPTVQVRFLFGSGIGIDRDGWYIQHVELGGVPLLGA